MTATPAPKVTRVAWSIITSLIKTRPPSPSGGETVNHSGLKAVLSRLDANAIGQLPGVEADLIAYLAAMMSLDPDRLTRSEALAYWLNVYNASALRVAASAARRGAETVLGLAGGFTAPMVSVAGELLSLDAVEHAKVRRFGDPRIHAALVCGSVSCPTLRREPYGGNVDAQLDDQIRRFLSGGALRADPDRGQVTLSPVFSWFGGDFTRPHRMPTFLPARRERVLEALLPWLDEATTAWIADTQPAIRFGSYDWRLACAVG